MAIVTPQRIFLTAGAHICLALQDLPKAVLGQIISVSTSQDKEQRALSATVTAPQTIRELVKDHLQGKFDLEFEVLQATDGPTFFAVWETLSPDIKVSVWILGG